MDSRRKTASWILPFTIILGILLTPPSHSYTLTGGRLVEDFSTDDFADYSNTTGLWNIVDHAAQAKAYADAAGSGTTRPITFGDGSDGVLDSTSGYAFNTDSKPSGYNFRSVNITGGTITVTGSNPLIIRSLTTVNITPTLSSTGGSGSAGAAAALATTLTTPSASTPVGSQSAGGAGGAANPGGQIGSDGKQYDGTNDAAATGGAAGAGAVAGGNGNAGIGGPGDYDTVGGFVGGAGGGGGGGHANGATHATGGSGGAGGGVIRIVAVGNLTVGTITAKGGAGGAGADEDGVNCSGNESGHGAGGNGGAIWLQTLKTLSSIDQAAAGNVNGGSGGAGAGCGVGNAGVAGTARGDAVTGALPASYDTASVPASQTNVVVSKAYDLGTLNAKFASAASAQISSVTNGGSISATYAGSVDGVSWSEYTSDISTLGNKNYRYLKFKLTLRTAGAVAASPKVTQVAIDFSDAGLSKVDLKLKPSFSPGCGNLSRPSGPERGNATTNFFALILLLIMARFALRFDHSRDSGQPDRDQPS